ncbi:unnamed protein product [Arabidopsis halleri]
MGLYLKILELFESDYMEEYEVKVPFQSLQALGCHVDAFCPAKKKTGERCPTAIHDVLRVTKLRVKKQATLLLYDDLVIPGGRAPEYLALNKHVLNMGKEFMNSEKPVTSTSHRQQTHILTFLVPRQP